MTAQHIGNTHGLRYEADGDRRAKAAPTSAGFAPQTSKAKLVENLRNAIMEMVYSSQGLPNRRNSDHLSQRLGYDYAYLARVFSEATGSTVEQCIIAYKIRRVKELLLRDELNLSQISYQLNYSSVAHLSNQFKKVTGLTPTLFKKRTQKIAIIPESTNDVNSFCNCVKGPEVKRVSFVS